MSFPLMRYCGRFRHAFNWRYEGGLYLGFRAFLAGKVVSSHVPNGALETVAGIAGKFPLVRRVWFFGSTLTGVSHKGGLVRSDSDLDFAFEIDPDPTMPKSNSQLALFIEVADLEVWSELEQSFGCRIGLTPLDDVRAYIIEGSEPSLLIFDRDSF